MVRANTPNEPTPLLSDNSSITNVTFELPSSPAITDGTSNVAQIANISNFINGTASGLTCFIHPDTSFVGWPYGGGGINAVSSGTPSSGGGGEGGSASSSAVPSPSDSGNGAIRWQTQGIVFSLSVVGFGCLVGGVLVL